MRRQVTDGVIIAALVAVGASQLSAQAVGGRKVVRADAAGGSAQAVRGLDGTSGARASGFTHSVDGRWQHQGGGALDGANGSANRQGSVQHNADGTTSGSRTMSAPANSGATDVAGDVVAWKK